MKMPNFKWSNLTKYQKRQYSLAGALLTFILAITFGSMYLMDVKQQGDAKKDQDKAVEKMKQSEIASPIKGIDGAAYLESSVGGQLDVQKKQIDDLKKELETLKKPGLSSNGLPSNPNLTNLPPLPPEGMKSANLGKNKLGKPNLNESADENEIIQSIVFTKGANPISSSNRQSNPITSSNQFARNSNSVPNRQDVVTKSGIRPNILVTEDGGHVYGMDGQNARLNSTGKFRALQSYIPTGSFFRAVLLGGLDAPTGGESANSNPHPVLMQITDMAQLPNSFRVNFKKCFVTGTGYGDLSSERAMIRTEQLSCVGVDGRAIDIPIKGYIAGDDGKTGVRGRLVSKQGAVIKNALISGVLSGIGQGLSSAASVTSTNGLGTVSTISEGKKIQNALGTGASGAFDRLAEYYVKLADKMFPVIEIDAGRTVEIVLMKGFQIEGE